MAFYDGVEETPENIKASWETLGLTTEQFLGEVGLSIPSGEKGRSVLELTWARPTAEVNGIWGGYTGEGFKTVIAAKASAKVSFRLVGTQDPARSATASAPMSSRGFRPIARSSSTRMAARRPSTCPMIRLC
jgi:acetylornithine deacetylase/succinyl-diaminopimelate desuccinylase-like protein